MIVSLFGDSYSPYHTWPANQQGGSPELPVDCSGDLHVFRPAYDACLCGQATRRQQMPGGPARGAVTTRRLITTLGLVQVQPHLSGPLAVFQGALELLLCAEIQRRAE